MKRYWLELLGAALALLTPLVKSYIWDPPEVYYWLVGLLLVDAAAHTYMLKKPPEPFKHLKRLVFMTFVLAVAHNLGKHVEALMWLPGVVLLPTVLWHLRRLMRTGGALGWVEPGVVDMWELKLRRREESDEEKPNPQSDAESIEQEPGPDAEQLVPSAAARGPDNRQ